jgi:CBS domain-containing membrane protein
MTPAPVDAAQPSGRRGYVRFFAPILAGATLRDRAIACLGALLGVGATGLICSLVLGDDPHLPLLVAPMGASALLLFAVPASPLAQPWPIIGGNILSATVGLAVARFVPDPTLAAGLAVALAICVMSLARCLHPPGGAVALTAAWGGPAVAAYGYAFAFVPVGLNSIVLTLLGWAFHKLTRHAYPRAAAALPGNIHGTSDLPSRKRVGFNDEDIDKALSDLGETFDIDRADLDRLLRRVELRAIERSHGRLSCADIMSRDIIRIDRNAAPERARALLLEHEVRTLPVVDHENRVLGSVGLRELTRPGSRIADVMSAACMARPDQAALELIAPLTDGQNHAVVITDETDLLLGMITQTDLLTILARPATAG